MNLGAHSHSTHNEVESSTLKASAGVWNQVKFTPIRRSTKWCCLWNIRVILDLAYIVRSRFLIWFNHFTFKPSNQLDGIHHDIAVPKSGRVNECKVLLLKMPRYWAVLVPWTGDMSGSLSFWVSRDLGSKCIWRILSTFFSSGKQSLFQECNVLSQTMVFFIDTYDTYKWWWCFFKSKSNKQRQFME